jgi:hypothetical protein
VLGTLSVKNGVVVFPIASLPRGKHAITAVYSGDADLVGSTSAVLTETIK